MSNTAAIEIRNLAKCYGTKKVLQLDALQLAQGKITGIIGPSGAGKSTLLRLINLLEAPTEGEIHFFGSPVPENRPDRLVLQRRMTMVFQKPVLLNRSVWDNIAYGLQARSLPLREINRRVEAALEMIGLAAQGKQRAVTLSGGEAQRVAFARASVLRPEILLLDEATANLDPANVELLEKMILSLQKEAGTTVILVTHNLFQARRLADELVFLYQGRLVEAGPTEKFFSSPEKAETKAFVEGRMIY
ncbi:MAG TPA: phosphate ABC transporter ATP-binding protein [Firmicutes bacterium]|nr:phosphate ABC transporter ATP-binding protein [Bacillota bacterium]